MSSVKQRSKKSDSSLKSDEKADQAADACMLIEDLKKNHRSIAVTVYEKCMTPEHPAYAGCFHSSGNYS